jgi:hypothetical protein
MIASSSLRSPSARHLSSLSSLALVLGCFGCGDATAPARAPSAPSRPGLTQEEIAARFEELLARENGPFGKHEVAFLDGKVQGKVEAASKPTVDCEGASCDVTLDMGRDADGDPSSIVCTVTTEVAAFGPLVAALVHEANKTEIPTLTTRATSEGLAVSFVTDAVGQVDDNVVVTTPKAAALYGRGYTAICHDRMPGGRKTFERVVGELFDSLRANDATSKRGLFAAGFHTRAGERENGFRFDLVASRDGETRGYQEVSVHFALESAEGSWKAYDAIGVVVRDAAGNVEDMRRRVWIHGVGPIQLSAKPSEDKKMRVKLEAGNAINAIELTPPAKASTEVWSAPDLLAVSNGRAPSYTYSMPAIHDRDPTLQRVTVKRTAPGVLQLHVGNKTGTAVDTSEDDLEVHVDERGLVKKVVGSASVSERLFTWGELPMGRGRIAGGAARGAK